jgi:hemerythrin HHE cation binding domain-containing protein
MDLGRSARPGYRRGMETSETTKALEAARGTRASLESAMHDLERAIARPQIAPSWPPHVRQALDRLSRAFDDHVEATEGAGGLFDEIVARAPRLSHSIERFRWEHGSLRSALAGCRQRADDDDPFAVRALATQLIARIARHRQEGSDLIYEAYLVDFGALD